MSVRAAELHGTIEKWHDDAVLFVRDCFDVEPDEWQIEALRLIVKPETRRLAMKACKGPGKTACLAWIILWFLTTRERSVVGCTSITEANIDSALWPELSRWLTASSFLSALFVWSRTRVSRRSDPSAWFAEKRTWPKTGNPDEQANALAGFHARHVMFVLDESGGIPQGVMVTAEAVLATEDSEAKVVQAGNPTHTTGPLFRACTRDRHLWRIVTITGDPDDPRRSPRISKQWAQEQIDSYGRDNPWVMVNVLGEFPPTSIDALLGIEDVEKAMKRRSSPEMFEWHQKRLGIDVARFGDDRTVLFPRQGPMTWKPIIMRGEPTTTIAVAAARAMVNWQKRGQRDEPTAFIDDTGHWGHGVLDQLQLTAFPTYGVVYSDRARNPRFKTKRDENWMLMAEWVKAGGCLPDYAPLVPELVEVTYTFVNGQFRLEPKDLMKKRLGYSPDLADALSLTFDMPEMPNEVLERIKGKQGAVRDFDPFQIADGNDRVERDFDPNVLS